MDIPSFALRVEKITKKFNDKYVLNDIDLNVSEGEFRVILGPSGTGKTTLLNIISGLEKPDGGRIFVHDEEITKLPPEKRNVGYIFQDLGLFSSLNVQENIAYGLRVRKFPEAEIKEKVEEYAEKLGILELLDKFPNEISGGQKQLVALARTLIIEPSLLLMDEPLSSLDTFLRNNMRWYLRNLSEELNLTVIYVSHDIDDCQILADRVSILDGGRIIEEGEKKEILSSPKKEGTARLLGYNIINLGERKIFVHPQRVKRGGNIKVKIIREEIGIAYHYLLETQFGQIYAVFDSKFNEEEGISIEGV